MQAYVETGTDVKVLYDRPSQLKDGSPAREVAVEWVLTKHATLGSIKDGPG